MPGILAAAPASAKSRRRQQVARWVNLDSLPGPAKDYVWRRLWEVLDGRDQRKEFATLTPADRAAIRQILLETRMPRKE